MSMQTETAMSFYLVRVDRDENDKIQETPLADFGTFESGVEAARRAKAASTSLGAKVQCRRLSQAGDWRAPIKAMFESGEIRPLPEKWSLPLIEDHFAHTNDEHPGVICFVDGEANGIIKRFTMLKPGRYITRFHEEAHGQLDDATRRKMIALIDPSGEIHFAKTPKEIERVYVKGPESCMDGEHDFSDLPIWPTAVYGAGDLAVAYTVNNRGRIQSRALCWPEKKLFGRTYGAEERMKEALEAEGFKSIRNERVKEGSTLHFGGAKLLKEQIDDSSDFVMPYFDDILCAIDRGDHFEIVNVMPKDQETRFVTSGGTEGQCELKRYCVKMQGAHDASDFMFVHGVNAEWSAVARHHYAFKCDMTQKWWTKDFKVQMENYQSWSKEAFAEHGAVCAQSGTNFPKDRMTEAKDGKLVARVNLVRYNRQLEINEGRAKSRPHFTERDSSYGSRLFDWHQSRWDQERDAYRRAVQDVTLTVTSNEMSSRTIGEWVDVMMRERRVQDDFSIDQILVDPFNENAA
jgi:hypothetical protein